MKKYFIFALMSIGIIDGKVIKNSTTRKIVAPIATFGALGLGYGALKLRAYAEREGIIGGGSGSYRTADAYADNYKDLWKTKVNKNTSNSRLLQPMKDADDIPADINPKRAATKITDQNVDNALMEEHPAMTTKAVEEDLESERSTFKGTRESSHIGEEAGDNGVVENKDSLKDKNEIFDGENVSKTNDHNLNLIDDGPKNIPDTDLHLSNNNSIQTVDNKPIDRSSKMSEQKKIIDADKGAAQEHHEVHEQKSQQEINSTKDAMKSPNKGVENSCIDCAENLHPHSSLEENTAVNKKGHEQDKRNVAAEEEEEEGMWFDALEEVL